MSNYNLYHELDLDPGASCEELADLLDDQIRCLLDEGLPVVSPEVDQVVTARTVLSDVVKRGTYDAALSSDDGQVTITWLHLLADARKSPRRVLGTPAAPQLPKAANAGTRRRPARWWGLAAGLVLLGSLVVVVTAVLIDPSEEHAAVSYLRITVMFFGYVLCILAFCALILASGKGRK